MADDITSTWVYLVNQGWATVALQLLVNYKSHHASAFGSHACNCQFCNASWDL
ncbi:unnamed protein product [Staurois parvus]|uniref:Uncharacterized protein n=1 Tax=Staurois parvus TaxID=386267 RepID=A0ABN9BNK3_9NEOB|nr:unnamed protein product [Staurois parvus]